MPFKVSVLFNMQADRIAGWSENFWNSALDSSTVSVEVENLLDALIPLHGGQSVAIGVRISTVETKRVGKIVRLANTPIAPAEATQSDYMATALELVLNGSGGLTTRQWIKGVPDSVITNGGRYVPDSNWIPHRNAFINYLEGGGHHWAMRCLDKTKKDIIIEAIDTDGIITATAHGIPAVDTNSNPTVVRTYGLLPAYGSLIPSGRINRTWQINQVTANSFHLVGWPDIPQVLLQPKSKVRQVVFTYPSIADVEFEFATSHKVGRPNLPVGGRRRRR